jgi:aspartate aminotransferase
MFGNLETLPPDPILGVTAAFRADPDPRKIDLGVGVYRDENGNTPVPAAVREAERQVLAAQSSKTYVGPLGNPEFNERIVALALGELAGTLRERTATIQTVGGCGALRMAAELLHAASPGSVVHVSDPTWANHEPLLGNSGIALQRYPYYEPATRRLAFDRMLEHIEGLPAGAVLLLHGSCHNPTGVDLELAQWRAVADVLERRGVVPFVDLAYQGLGDDLETDVAGLRLLAARLPTLLLAISCSKNFGLYRERTGALAVIAENAATARAISTHQARIGRRMYSMPPDHGAAVAARVLGEAQLRRAWQDETVAMVARMKALRALLAGRLAGRRPDRDFSWLTGQRGMFSLLGLAPAGIRALCAEEHVYVPPDGRINIAGVSNANVDRVADALVRVLERR